MQTATSETEIKSRYLSICVHHYTLRAPCSKGQGIWQPYNSVNKNLLTLPPVRPMPIVESDISLMRWRFWWEYF